MPIYHGEAVYTPHDYKTAGEHSGEYGEASHGPGFTNPGTTYTGGGYQGRDKRYSVSEGWIQCGWCYKQYHKELESVKVWEKRLWMWGLLCIPFGAVGFGLGYSKILDLYGWMGKPDAPPLYSAIWIGIGFLVLGSVAGFLINWLKHGSKPVPDRYKLRENPNREKQ